MVFPTQFDARDRIISNSGDRIKQLYEARVDNQGHIDLVESGTEDLYDYIQSFRESCDIKSGEVLEFVFGDDYMFHVVIVDDDKEEEEND